MKDARRVHGQQYQTYKLGFYHLHRVPAGPERAIAQVRLGYMYLIKVFLTAVSTQNTTHQIATMSVQSTIDPNSPYLVPFFKTDGSQAESATLQAVMKKLNMQSHPEGGYFVETDRATLRVPDPFRAEGESTRSAATTIHYLLTPKSNLGGFHRNRARTVHTLHKGRGRYVVIHADEAASKDFPGGYGKEDAPESERWAGKKARVETFVVGQNVLAGEKLQWIVEGGKYKTSFLLPDEDGGSSSEGLLISETVVPGFEFEDHDFMKADRMEALVTAEQAEEMKWMLRKETE